MCLPVFSIDNFDTSLIRAVIRDPLKQFSRRRDKNLKTFMKF